MVSPPDSQKKLKDNFGLVILRWESLRVAYNVVLVVTCLLFTLLADPENFRDPEFWMYLAIGAAVTNVLFLVGPAVDGYLTWWGVWTAPLALLMFFAGTGLTIYLAVDWIGRY